MRLIRGLPFAHIQTVGLAPKPAQRLDQPQLGGHRKTSARTLHQKDIHEPTKYYKNEILEDKLSKKSIGNLLTDKVNSRDASGASKTFLSNVCGVFVKLWDVNEKRNIQDCGGESWKPVEKQKTDIFCKKHLILLTLKSTFSNVLQFSSIVVNAINGIVHYATYWLLLPFFAMIRQNNVKKFQAMLSNVNQCQVKTMIGNFKQC